MSVEPSTICNKFRERVMMFSRLISKQRFSTTFLATTLLAAMVSQPAAASAEAKHSTPVSVSDGKLLWAGGEPVYLFGVNYSAPFAYGYRAISRRGIDHKAAIDMDVDHIARLKLDAYRIHVWDKLITDKQGNMLDNEYVELFDYLMMRLQESGIKAILTPIAWWGAGYPEPDPSEPGFAVGFSKNDMNEKPELIKAQQRYLTQFMAQLREVTKNSGHELSVGCARGDIIGQPLGNSTLEWREWVDRNLIDSLSCRDRQPRLHGPDCR